MNRIPHYVMHAMITSVMACALVSMGIYGAYTGHELTAVLAFIGVILNCIAATLCIIEAWNEHKKMEEWRRFMEGFLK